MIRVKRNGFLDKVLSRLPLLKIIPVCDPRTRIKVMIGGKKKLEVFSINTSQAEINREYIYFDFMPSKPLYAATYNMNESNWYFKINAKPVELRETRTIYV
jgi:hypothetical protein